jgi:hypothetical protein
MDSRQEPRFEADQEVAVTLLGDVETVFSAKVINFSGRGMCLLSNQAIPSGSALKIELPDTMLLGEVIYSRPQGGGHQAGIELEHALYRTRDLAVLAERLRGDRVAPLSHDKEVTPR